MSRTDLTTAYELRRDWSSDVFFFQAEDGIRDYDVTGVQTCALPIWKPRNADEDAFWTAVAAEN